jgi:hypothetical protein
MTIFGSAGNGSVARALLLLPPVMVFQSAAKDPESASVVIADERHFGEGDESMKATSPVQGRHSVAQPRKRWEQIGRKSFLTAVGPSASREKRFFYYAPLRCA